MGVLLQTGVRAASGSFGHGARSCEQTLPVVGIAPTLSGRRRSRCADIVQAIDWLARLLRWCVDGMRSTRSVEYAEVNIVPL